MTTPGDGTSAIDAAREYLGRRYAPIPVPYRKKRPVLEGWPDLRLTEDDLASYFDGRRQNVGILTGEPSGGLGDVDLDTLQAVALAPRFLPATGGVFGRPGKPRSHWLYACDPLVPTEQLEDLDGTMLVELRLTNVQTVFPPSTHESGEAIRWEQDGTPLRIGGRVLLGDVRRLAAATLLARRWPAEGSRHRASLALIGGLLRAGWAEDDATDFVLAVAEVAGDEEATARVANVRTTATRLHASGKATGWPTLAALLADGDAAVTRVRDWLGVAGRGPRLVVGEDCPRVAEAPMPDPIPEEAYHGLIGDTVRTIAPGSEASPAAIFAHCLSGYGALVGKETRAMVGTAPHPARINTLVVGRTSKGRKGTAYRAVEHGVVTADDMFQGRVMEGLSSGEGLIWQVRDPIYKMMALTKGEPPEEVCIDPGVEDKRLWVVESEFATVLRVMQREGNTLTAIMRRAWDRDDLRTLTKNSPAVATGAHIAVTGHVSKTELLRYLDRTELANGLANRFLFFASERARLLPDGEVVDEDALASVAARLRLARDWAREPRVLVRDDAATAIWHEVYPALTGERPGMFGEATGRAEAQVLRVSGLYAALDCSALIRAEHLLAALAIWRYCEQSARWVFGDATGDPVADAILAALRRVSPLMRTEISDLLGRHAQRSRIDQALGLLLTAGLARFERIATGGRDREAWHAV